MIRRRLHRQIYVAMVAALALTAILAGLAFSLLDDERRPSRTAMALARNAVALALPPADAPPAEQGAALERIGADGALDLALFDARGSLVAATGGWPAGDGAARSRHRDGAEVRLPDGRRVALHLHSHHAGRFLALPLVLACVTLAIGLASYPLVRRLTGRLERLRASVERMGGGDLAARARVEGRDEIAGLASSFNDAAGRIETLVEAHRALLANASHELRTPLARIRLGIAMFRETGREERLADAETDIRQLDRLIDEILTLGRLDAAPVPMEPGIDLLGLVAEECARTGVDVGGEPVRVTGNRDLLQRLVRNLVENALRHGMPPVAVAVAAGEGVATLTVRDGGTGIPAADRTRVFARFQRGSGKQNVDGYGLGLPLVREIAQAHGGRVEIAPGPASAFVVTLPRPPSRS